MIGLRDRYVSRRRGEAWLLLGDSLAAGGAILLASGAAGAGATLADRLIVLLWAMIPGALSRAVDPVLVEPRGAARNVAIAALSGGTLVVLVLIGLELMGSRLAAGVPRELRAPWQLAIVIAWGLGFLLFLPRVYLARDLLLGGATVLSLALGRAGSALLAPVALFGLLLSGAMRHQLLDVFVEVRRPRVNAHNARLIALAFAISGALLFAATHAGAARLFPALGLSQPARALPALPAGIDLAAEGGEERSGAAARDAPAAGARVHGDAAEGAEPGASAPLAGAADEAVVRGEDGGESGAPLRPGAHGGAAAAGIDGGEADAGSGPRIGFSRAVRLGALVGPQSDPRLVLVARVHDSDGFRTPNAALPPSTLWRGITLATFDAEGEAWREEALVAGTQPWPAGSLRFAAEESAADHVREEGRADLILEIEIRSAVMPTLPMPYTPLRLNPPHGGSGEYRLNAAGDLFPVGGVPEGTTYALRIAPLPAGGAPWPTAPVDGRHSDPRYAEVPSAEAIGFDLAAHAASIFGGAVSVPERIARLREHFARDFRYDIEVRFRGDRGWLREFCLAERVGNCEYFATAAALLLRAAGVSTRVVAGFLGYEWDAVRGEILVRNGAAHLWIEVYFPGAGWFPVDATAWVPPAGSALAASDPRVPRESDPAASPVAIGETGGGADETAESGAAEEARRESAWIEELPPPGDRESEPARDAEEPARAEARATARRAPTGADEEREEGAGSGAKLALIAIAIALAAIIIRRELRPEPEGDDEEGEDALAPRGGIPDPRAGLPELPADLIATDPRGRIVVAYHRLQGALAERRRHRRPAETPRAHGERIGERVPAAREDLGALEEDLYSALYAPEEPEASAAARAEETCVRLRSRLG